MTTKTTPRFLKVVGGGAGFFLRDMDSGYVVAEGIMRGADADLLVAAWNSLTSISPSHPLAAAEGMKELVDAINEYMKSTPKFKYSSGWQTAWREKGDRVRIALHRATEGNG